MDTAALIREAMKDAGVDAGELAKRMGRSVHTVYMWTSGKREASVSTLERIADALGGELVLRIDVEDVDSG